MVKLLGADRSWLLVHVVAFDLAESTAPKDTAAISSIKAERIGGQAAQSVVVGGAPARSLPQLAAEHDVDLITVGRRGSGPSTATMGDVAQKVSHLATVPVLIVGAGAPKPPSADDQANRRDAPLPQAPLKGGIGDGHGSRADHGSSQGRHRRQLTLDYR